MNSEKRFDITPQPLKQQKPTESGSPVNYTQNDGSGFMNEVRGEAKKEGKRKLIYSVIITAIILAVACPLGLRSYNRYTTEKKVKAAKDEAARIAFANFTNNSKENNVLVEDELVLRIDYPKNDELSYIPLTLVAGIVLKDYEVWVNGSLATKEEGNEWYDYFKAFLPLEIGHNTIRVEAKNGENSVKKIVRVERINSPLASNFDSQGYMSNFDDSFDYLGNYNFDFLDDDSFAVNVSSGQTKEEKLAALNGQLEDVRTQIQREEEDRNNKIQAEYNKYETKRLSYREAENREIAALDCSPYSGICNGQINAIRNYYRNLTDIAKSNYESQVAIIKSYSQQRIDRLRAQEDEILNEMNKLK